MREQRPYSAPPESTPFARRVAVEHFAVRIERRYARRAMLHAKEMPCRGVGNDT